MLAVAGRPPEGAGRDWAIEMKWDGVRSVTRCGGGSCQFTSRNGRDVTRAYPELAEAVAAVAGRRDLLVDGEIVALDPATGAPSFARLQHRMHVVRPGPALIADYPVQFFVFDLLASEGTSLLRLPYTERRARLDKLSLSGPSVQVPPYWIDVDADTMLKLAADHALEGIVCKRLTSIYEPGRRSPAWIKTPLRRTTEAVVAGWSPGSGRFHPTFGSLILGAHDAEGQLLHIGNVGTGFTVADRRVLRRTLDELARPTTPFDIPPPRTVTAVAHWVEPVLVADIEYREYAGDGLRHPSWRGLRDDKSPSEVTVPS
ncbi:non-homologous end-joining DNA ligase [Nocardia sp. NPDC003482]